MVADGVGGGDGEDFIQGADAAQKEATKMSLWGEASGPCGR